MPLTLLDMKLSGYDPGVRYFIFEGLLNGGYDPEVLNTQLKINPNYINTISSIALLSRTSQLSQRINNFLRGGIVDQQERRYQQYLQISTLQQRMHYLRTGGFSDADIEKMHEARLDIKYCTAVKTFIQYYFNMIIYSQQHTKDEKFNAIGYLMHFIGILNSNNRNKIDRAKEYVDDLIEYGAPFVSIISEFCHMLAPNVFNIHKPLHRQGLYSTVFLSASQENALAGLRLNNTPLLQKLWTLKEQVDLPFWDRQGIGFLCWKTPDHILKLRELLTEIPSDITDEDAEQKLRQQYAEVSACLNDTTKGNRFRLAAQTNLYAGFRTSFSEIVINEPQVVAGSRKMKVP